MSDTRMFEYDAPTYVDFAKGFDESAENVDNFFDNVMSSESQRNLNSTIVKNVNLSVPKIESEFCTPDKHSTPEPVNNIMPCNIEDYLQEENLIPNVKDTLKTPNPEDGRRSRVLFEALGELCPGSLKTHKMVTRKDPRTPLLELRNRTVPKSFNFLVDYNHGQSKVAREILFENETDDLINQINNLSVADDNVRNSSKKQNSNMESLVNETITIENTDNLNTGKCQNIRQVQFYDNKTRALKRKSEKSSPSTSILHGNKYISLVPGIIASTQRGSRLFKQNTLNPKPIVSGTLGVRRIALPKYNFSAQVNQQIPKFPRVFVRGTKNDCVKVVDTDVAGMTVVNKEIGHHGVGLSVDTNKKCTNKSRTKPQPFSFYEADMERLRKKEEKIKKVIEEEKKLAEFHATPLPRFVLKAKKQKSYSQQSLNSTTCSHSTTCSVTSEQFIFKANPPAVLHQKPFIPRKSMKPCGQVCEFTLHTEGRSQQRELYESKRKQRELEKQLYLQEREKEQQEREDAAYRAARKSTVHKPLPIPKF